MLGPLIEARPRRIVIANRSLERAEKLARELHGYAISLNDLPSYLGDADLVVSSTAARGYIIDREAMQRAVQARRRKPVFMIDLAVPRDIDPRIADVEDIYLYSIDDLRDVIAYQLHADGPRVELELRSGGLERTCVIEKADGDYVAALASLKRLPTASMSRSSRRTSTARMTMTNTTGGTSRRACSTSPTARTGSTRAA